MNHIQTSNKAKERNKETKQNKQTKKYTKLYNKRKGRHNQNILISNRTIIKD